MKYRDLVEFQPIEEVIELRDANKTSRARDLVSSYVISEQMSRQLSDLIAANLDFAAADPRGIVVVGNYGTGKSHLMAVVSSVAEHAEMLDLLTHERTRQAFKPVAGKYLVARMELGAVKTALRDIVIRELESHLKSWGVNFTFPPQTAMTNHKDALEAMMAAVEAAHPGKGVLLVIDELLDYLRAFRQEEVIGHFTFLRELGEASGNGRFRIMGGVQESLFTSPSFSFIANVVRRVQDRYLQASIHKEDLAFVVEARLLKKSAEQRGQIRSHLERFAPLFPQMQSRQDEYVRLFPVHPRYIEVFEAVEIAEKREVLKTLSREIRARLDEDVPTDTPGLIAYDSYWNVIAKTPSFLADHRVAEVENKGSVVLARVQASYPTPALKPAAERVVRALGVHRLAVGDIRKPIGLTAENLRDDLILMVPNLPEQDPEFLTTTIESILKNIRTTTNGQFISSGDNGQFYLDLDRVVDYEARIDERIDRLSEEALDRYYFEVLAQVMERPVQTHVAGYRIWEYEIEWAGHRVTRPGYLFFGGPNERSTAQPPRAFYIYFLGLFDQKPFDEKRQDDEVFFAISRAEDEFRHTVKRYASAMEWAANSSGDEKAQYQSLADKNFRVAAKWLRENLARAFDVTHDGRTRTVAEALASERSVAGGSGTRDVIDSISSASLANGFDRRWPEYPSFPRLTAPLTEDARPQAASEALRYVGGTLKTAQGSAVLDGLKLLQGDAIRTEHSPYAKHLLGILAAKPEGHVVNRDEVIQRVEGVDRDPRFGLEPEWVAVVLAALVYRGDIELSVNGTSLDTSNVALAAGMGAPTIANFRSFQRPRGMPMAALRRLFEMLGLNDALIQADADRAAVELQAAVAREIPTVIEVQRAAQSASVWGQEVWSPAEAAILSERASDYKQFLDRLSSFNTGGKLRLLKESAEQIEQLSTARAAVLEAQDRITRLQELTPLAEYLAGALNVLEPTDPLHERIREAPSSVAAAATGATPVADVVAHLQRLKAEYIRAYLERHLRFRLGPREDERAKALRESSAMKRLDALSAVDVMPAAQLTALKQRLAALRPCWAAEESELDIRPYCDKCMFRPALEPDGAEAEMKLREIEDAIDGMAAEWSVFLRHNLEDPVAQDGLRLLSEGEAGAAQDAVASNDVPDPAAIRALNTVFGGLQKVPIQSTSLIDSLRKGGPATKEEMQQRLDSLLSARLGSVDSTKARIVIE